MIFWEPVSKGFREVREVHKVCEMISFQVCVVLLVLFTAGLYCGPLREWG